MSDRFTEATRLLEIARDAARKMWVEQERGSMALSRFEFDRLVEARDDIEKWLEKPEPRQRAFPLAEDPGYGKARARDKPLPVNWVEQTIRVELSGAGKDDRHDAAAAGDPGQADHDLGSVRGCEEGGVMHYGDFDNLRTSVIAAAMVRQVFDHIDTGRGAPGEEDFDRFLEEADVIGSMVEAAMHRANAEEER